jgi:hypothetical protein
MLCLDVGVPWFAFGLGVGLAVLIVVILCQSP